MKGRDSMRIIHGFIFLMICAAFAAADEPTTQPADTRTFTSWQAMYREVPEELRPADVSKITDLQMDVINGVLAEKVANHRARLRTRVRLIEVTADGRYAGMPRIVGEYEKSAGVKVATVFYFPETEESKRLLVGLNKGDVVIGSGDISEVGFDRREGVRFMVRIVNTRLEKK